jgi:hypothetical protein
VWASRLRACACSLFAPLSPALMRAGSHPARASVRKSERDRARVTERERKRETERERPSERERARERERTLSPVAASVKSHHGSSVWGTRRCTLTRLSVVHEA